MRRTEIFERLLETSKSVFDRVEVTQGDFRGGMCKVRGETHLILNKGANLDTNLRLISNALADARLDETFLLPALREAIEKYSDR
ncbi:MAG: hypothetical protein V2A56_06815 [bacterium]